MDGIDILRTCVTLIFFFASRECFSEDRICIILYGEDLRSINRTEIVKKVTRLNETANSTKIDFHPFENLQSSFQGMFALIPGATAQKEAVVVSFLKGQESNVLHDIMKYRQSKHLNFYPENCMLSFQGFKQSNQECHTNILEQQRAILVMFPHFQGMKVAILSSQEPCSLMLSNNLIKELKIRNRVFASEDRTNVSLFSFSEEPLNAFQISSLMYKMKFFAPAIIILICDRSLQEIVLQVAAKHQMLGYGEIWIIPEFRNEMRASLTPVQLLTIERTVQTRGVSMVTESQIVLMSRYAKQLLQAESDIPRNVSKLILSVPCTSIHYANVKISVKTGNQSNWTAIYIKRGKGEFQFQPNSGLALSLFASKQQAIRFRVVTIFDPPFTIEARYLGRGDADVFTCDQGLPCRTMVTGNSTQGRKINGTMWRDTCCIGHSIELLQFLMRRLHFGADLYTVKDGFYGSKVNGTFNGLIGDVARKKADFALAGITMTSLRSTAVEFTSPFIRQDIGIVTLTTKVKLNFINWQFAVPIETSMIIAVFVGLLLGTILTYILENEDIAMKRLVDPQQYPPRYSWREGFTYYSGLTFQRDLGGKNPNKLGSRIMAVGFAFAMLVVMTTYTAVLTATKVTQKDTKPFLGVKDERMLNPTPRFKFATVPSTSIEGFFKDAPDENFQRMYRFMKKYNVRSVSEGLDKVKSGELQAFIHEYPFLKYFLSQQSTCVLKITGQPLGQSGFGLAMQKQSRWTDRFSYEILRLKELGMLADLDKKWLSSGCSETARNLQAPDALSLEYFGGLVLFVSIAFIAMFLMLPLEFAYQRYHMIPINALVSRILRWRETRKEKESVRSRPTLKSVSSQNNLAEFALG